MRIVYGADQEVALFVGRRIGFRRDKFADCAALGVVDRSGAPVAGVVFHDYSADNGTMQASIAALPGRVWCTRRLLTNLLSYPFLQVGVRNLYAMCRQSNDRAIDFNLRLGFRHAGGVEGYYPDGDAVLMRMGRDYFIRNFMPDLKMKEAA